MYGPLKQAKKTVMADSTIAGADVKATISMTSIQAQDALSQPVGLHILRSVTCTGRPYTNSCSYASC